MGDKGIKEKKRMWAKGDGVRGTRWGGGKREQQMRELRQQWPNRQGYIGIRSWCKGNTWAGEV